MNDIKIQSIFSSFLYTEDLSVDNTVLEGYSYELQRSDNGIIASNEGGWHSSLLDMSKPRIRPLFDLINTKLNELHKQLGFKDEFKQEVQEAWININKINQFNKPHTHPGSFFSGVYYIKAEKNAGAIEWINPIGAQPHTIPSFAVEHFNFYNANKWVQQPTPGKLIIFPPWLTHYTQPNQSGCDRISIAFNSRLVPTKLNEIIAG
jgi:uncharacterized protein (TIGR02466 family)